MSREDRNAWRRVRYSYRETPEENPRVKKLTKSEYIGGVESGDLMHVYDKEEDVVKVIKRDGYYPEEELKDFVNVDQELGPLYYAKALESDNE